MPGNCTSVLVSPQAPDSLGQLRGASSLLPPPCSLATSYSPAVPGIALTPSVCPCPQCGSGTEGVQGSPGFGGTRSWSPEPAGARAIPCPSPPPALQSLWMLPYSCHVLPPPLLLLVAYSSVSQAANSAKQGCIPSREGYLVSTSGACPLPRHPPLPLTKGLAGSPHPLFMPVQRGAL